MGHVLFEKLHFRKPSTYGQLLFEKLDHRNHQTLGRILFEKLHYRKPSAPNRRSGESEPHWFEPW